MVKRCVSIYFAITLHSFSKSILIFLEHAVYQLYFSCQGNRCINHIHVLQLCRQAVSSETLTCKESSV